MKVSHHKVFIPTIWQRIQIMCGMNVLMSGVMFTEHKPGNVAGTVIARITSITDPKDPKLALLLKVEAEKAVLANLPAKEQFEAAKKIQEDYKKVAALPAGPMKLPVK